MQKICVIGLGYIGLPTSAMFATHGCHVIGVDLNNDVIEALNRGRITIEEPYLDIMVQAAVRSGHLKASLKPEKADAFIIAVPTPLDKDHKSDLSYVVSALEMIVPFIAESNLVIVESTLPVGTIDELAIPILEKTGLTIGEELFLGHSPERVLPGKILWELVNNNRIIGGVNEISAKKIKNLYEIFVNGEIYLTSAATAEMCKIMENVFRDVNIALANEVAKICEKFGTNVWEVIKLSNKHPRVNFHLPGPGVGGHCLAIDPWFIIEKAPDLAQMISLARKTNDDMPRYVLNKIDEILIGVKDRKIVTILGITYKPNIDDVRESPIIQLINLLEKKENYIVNVYDPFYKDHACQRKNLLEAAEGSELIVLGVDHDVFRSSSLSDIASVMKNKRILDTRNFYKEDEVLMNGFEYHLLGRNDF